ncbi:MAG: acyltransferase [Alphaproteobacteria bacterium]|nr:acyltransferase [Alphaproteobacteria bacterium]
MASAPEPRTDELLPLTAIRGLAAWWVVLFHLRFLLAPWIPTSVLAVLARGNLAVDLFFILSGFVIALNYGERVGTGGAAGYRDFLVRRFARVYPLHLLILLGFAAYALAAAAFGTARLAEQGWEYFGASLLLVQNWGFADEARWNVPAWSISTEALAYLLFPLLLTLLKPARRRLWLLVAAVAGLGLSVEPFFWLTGHPFPNAVAETGLFRCLAQFAMGMALYGLWLRLPRRRWLAGLLVGVAALLAIGFVLWNAPVVPIAWAALILALAWSQGPGILVAPGLVWLGRISYATYLSHYLLLTLFKYAFVTAGEPVSPPRLALYLFAVLAASAGLYHGFERPAQAWLLARWTARHGRRRELVAAE